MITSKKGLHVLLQDLYRKNSRLGAEKMLVVFADELAKEFGVNRAVESDMTDAPVFETALPSEGGLRMRQKRMKKNDKK